MSSINPLCPKLLLHFDVNKTLINSDSVTGKTADEIFINQLAEDTYYQWDENYPAMTYKSYVYTILLPGSDSDRLLKKERRALICQFLEKVKEYPKITNSVHDQYRQLKEKANDSVFNSFITLIEKLRSQNINFIIILRSFGKDLKEVEKEIFHKTGIFFTKMGKFKEGVLHLKGDENKIIEKTEDLFKFFSKSQEHISIQDSYRYWNKHHEESMYGKKFIFNNNATVLSFLFDDNLTGDPTNDIIAPYTSEGVFVPTNELIGKILFPVHTGKAILEDDYFIKLINDGLKVNGYNVEIRQ